MHKVDARMEAGERPPQELIRKMGQLIGKMAKSVALVDGAGLHRSATRARITFEGGMPNVVRGPYRGSNELLASFAMITTTGLEQAIELATELGKAVGHREIEVGPVVEGWDLNGTPRPADAPYRFLLLVKADAELEAGAAQSADVRAVFERWKSAGILNAEATLLPSRRAVRSKVVEGRRHWIDGPFAESKELVAGYAILELDSLDEVKQFTEQYAAILGDNEVDVREVA
jgi:hypothetical protein